ncbi:AAA family ATPase [Micromonospora sp. NPDC050495]|uniref:AAA family ATPase n=1 Tax=Micromonospora sp. NPDC050495 TaxID=3154936 RepID=UPI00340CC368
MTMIANAFPVPNGPGAISAVALVGRDRELATLVEAVNRPPSLVVVDGEAGIGKTRLVDEVRSSELNDGRPAVVGACRQMDEPFPLFPVIEAVRLLQEPLRGATLPPVMGVLRVLVPELSDLLPPMPEPTDDRRAERHRVFRALVEVLRVAGPLVLVLEDLHWADADTPEFLRYLLADPPPELSLVLTYRGEEVAAPIRALSARLPAAVHQAHVHLAPLDAAGTGALAAAIVGVDRVSAEFASYLCERASGLPFAIEELLALLRVKGTLVYRERGWARRALDQLDVPAGIRNQVLERIGHLSRDTRSVLAAAAVLEVFVPLAVLIETCRLPPSRVWRAVDDSLAAGVLAEKGDRVGFRHVLAAQAVYGAIPELRRRRLHAQAADALQLLDPPPLVQIASHLRRGGRPDAWVDAAERAADQSLALGHDAQAIRLLEEVLRDAPLTDEGAGRIAVKLGRMLAGASLGGQGIVELLVAVLDRDLSGSVRGELSLLTAIAMDGGRSEPHRQRELCRIAVEHLDPDRHDLRAWAMACLGIPLDLDVPLTEHRDWQQRALAELTRVPDPEVQIRMLGKVAMVQVLNGDRQWRELLDRLEWTAATDPGTVGRHHRVEAWAWYAIGVEACYVGHHELAAEMVARAAGRPEAWELPQRAASLLSARALVDYCMGDWDGLLPQVEQLIDQLADFVPARTEVELIAGGLRLARGELGEARERLETSGAVLSQGGLGFAAALRLALAGGDPSAALAMVRQQMAVIRRRGTWAPLGRCLPAMTEVLVAAGELAGARELLAQAAIELHSLDVPLAGAALRHSRGVLASAGRQWREASAGLLAAAEAYEQLRCPYEAAQARERAAGCQFADGDPAAGESMHAALATYQRLGATWDLDRAARSARRYGLALPARHRRGRRGYGEQLSPREQEVAQLVTDGRTNQEIADALFLSVSTVEKHVAAVMRKLGAGSRRQIRDRMPAVPADAGGVPSI